MLVCSLEIILFLANTMENKVPFVPYDKQEAMENFVFPDNLQGMLIFCQMA